MTLAPPRKTNILIRSLALQLFLNYKTMQGAGYLFSLNSELQGQSEEKIKTGASFINGHPVFSSIALGALAQQLRESVDSEKANAISEWKHWISTPLGSIGDSLIWERLKPTLLAVVVSIMLLATGRLEFVWGWAAVGLLLVYNGVLWWFRNWGFARGFELGGRVSDLALHPALLRVKRVLRIAGILAAALVLAVGLAHAQGNGALALLQFGAGFLLMRGAAALQVSTVTAAFVTLLSSIGIYFIFSQTALMP